MFWLLAQAHFQYRLSLTQLLLPESHQYYIDYGFYFDVFMEENLATFEKHLTAKALMFYNILTFPLNFLPFFSTFNLITVWETYLYCLQSSLIFKEMANLLYYCWISLHT